MMTIAARTRDARKSKGLSQSELARRIGVTPQAVQAVEAGIVERPGFIVKLAEALETSPRYLESGDEDVCLFSEEAIRLAVIQAMESGLLNRVAPSDAADVIIALAVTGERSRRRNATE